MNYKEFLDNKTQAKENTGFDPDWIPDKLFPFQKELLTWACNKGSAAIFADCGLGKTFMQLAWAENVARKTGGRVLILTPIAVAFQTVKEGARISVDVMHRRDSIDSSDRIVVTNYERLHYFSPDDFAGVVCDESSILKCYSGKMRNQITSFMAGMKYRLLCTATPSPNDYIELGTSSEALGYMRRVEMLGMFFVNAGDSTQKWRLKKHAHSAFWQWMCTWARAMQKPSDLGAEFVDDGFDLPRLIINEHEVYTEPDADSLFKEIAIGLNAQRKECRETMPQRCQKAADLVMSHNKPFVVWCNLNAESEALHRLIPDAVEIKGADTEDKKARAFRNFADGNIRGIITKATIAGFGLNWQHCAHQVYFPSHSYEQYYQAIRRCWRFGQTREVTIDVIMTEGLGNVVANLKRKTDIAQAMFSEMTKHMRYEAKKREDNYRNKLEIPSWVKE